MHRLSLLRTGMERRLREWWDEGTLKIGNIRSATKAVNTWVTTAKRRTRYAINLRKTALKEARAKHEEAESKLTEAKDISQLNDEVFKKLMTSDWERPIVTTVTDHYEASKNVSESVTRLVKKYHDMERKLKKAEDDVNVYKQTDTAVTNHAERQRLVADVSDITIRMQNAERLFGKEAAKYMYGELYTRDDASKSKGT
jgi:hypothetical protein